MKILLVNVVCGIKSTGRICTDIATYAEELGHEVKIGYGRENVPSEYRKYAVKIGSKRDVLFHGLRKLLFDGDGFGSKIATRKFIEWVKEYNPDVIHLHNILGYYLNLPLLFDYIRNSGKTVIWTLHDCSSFTGGCEYFEYSGCDKWKNQACDKCPYNRTIPKRILYYRPKKKLAGNLKLYGDLKNIIYVTPSNWLKEQVAESFLGNNRIEVISNGIDLDVFKRRESDLRTKIGALNKNVILGVALPWSKRKGFDDFLKLSSLLQSDKYLIILIGLSEEQLKNLPCNILGIERTDSAEQLAQYYSMSDVFVNPTYEDNYPTTNLEAIACGTPVVTYNTGGSPESASIYGSVVPKGDVDGLFREIEQICSEDKKVLDESLIHYLDKKRMISEYLELYEKRSF